MAFTFTSGVIMAFTFTSGIRVYSFHLHFGGQGVWFSPTLWGLGCMAFSYTLVISVYGFHLHLGCEDFGVNLLRRRVRG